MAEINPDYVEVDCKHFDPEWLLDHPDFPLAQNPDIDSTDDKEK